jgi:uncharacterized repeat protein (TIGR03833 family)
MDGRSRSRITRGSRVSIVQKADQASGRRTEGVVAEILTRSPTHPHGIKVRLETGEVGRVQEVLTQDPARGHGNAGPSRGAGNE